jgi:predicted cupin superfamily sugar epimerase
MYHHYLGGPLEVLLLHADGTSATRVVGPDLSGGMRPQLLIPGGTFHAARLPAGGRYALLGTSAWVDVEPADVELAIPDKLIASYPAAKKEIRAFTSWIGKN